MYAGIKTDVHAIIESSATEHSSLKRWNEATETEQEGSIFQLHNKHIVALVRSGILILDQQAAHERILYEKYKKQMETGNGPSQQSLFPQVLELGAADFEVLKDLSPEIRALGFDLQEFGQNSFVIHGTPADVPSGDERRMIEKLLEQYKNNQSKLTIDKRESIIRAMVRSNATRSGTPLDKKEMKQLVDELFACEKPFLGIDGKATMVKLGLEDIDELFKK